MTAKAVAILILYTAFIIFTMADNENLSVVVITTVTKYLVNNTDVSKLNASSIDSSLHLLHEMQSNETTMDILPSVFNEVSKELPAIATKISSKTISSSMEIILSPLMFLLRVILTPILYLVQLILFAVKHLVDVLLTFLRVLLDFIPLGEVCTDVAGLLKNLQPLLGETIDAIAELLETLEVINLKLPPGLAVLSRQKRGVIQMSWNMATLPIKLTAFPAIFPTLGPIILPIEMVYWSMHMCYRYIFSNFTFPFLVIATAFVIAKMENDYDNLFNKIIKKIKSSQYSDT